MPAFGPIKRPDLIRALRQAGFDGGKHQFMVRNQLRLVIPNPHAGEISRDLLAHLLRQADISRDEWEKL